MIGLSPESLREAQAVARMRLLFGKMPAGIVSALVGVLLLFVLLLDLHGAEAAKGWSAYMLAVVGFRGWLWHAFQGARLSLRSLIGWEAAYVLSALLMGIGWAALNLLFLPGTHIYAQFMLITAAIIVAFSGTVTFGLSHAAFWAVTLPTLVPAFYRFYEGITAAGIWPAYSLLLCVVVGGLVTMLQLTNRRSMLENLRRRIESEALLAEQQAIFESATLGIAVLEHGRVVKANPRLGEMLGLRIDKLMELPFAVHLVNPSEFPALSEAAEEIFRKGHSYHNAIRLRRADGREFWAEINGRRMAGGGPERSVWLIGDAPLRPS